MPSSGHQPPPADPRCDCGGCREFRAITLNPRREIAREVREIEAMKVAVRRAKLATPRGAA